MSTILNTAFRKYLELKIFFCLLVYLD